MKWFSNFKGRAGFTTPVERIDIRPTQLTNQLNFSRKAAKTQRTKETKKEGMGGCPGEMRSAVINMNFKGRAGLEVFLVFFHIRPGRGSLQRQ